MKNLKPSLTYWISVVILLVAFVPLYIYSFHNEEMSSSSTSANWVLYPYIYPLRWFGVFYGWGYFLGIIVNVIVNSYLILVLWRGLSRLVNRTHASA